MAIVERWPLWGGRGLISQAGSWNALKGYQIAAIAVVERLKKYCEYINCPPGQKSGDCREIVIGGDSTVICMVPGNNIHTYSKNC